MNNKFDKWEDFNNISLKVKLGRKSYDAILLKRNNSLVLRVNMIKDIENWRNHKKFYSLINGTIIFSNEKVTLLDCQFIGQHYNGPVIMTKAELDYRIDRIVLGKKISKEESKNIKQYEVEYNNIDNFTNSKPYTMNLETLEYKGNLDNYDIILKDTKISVIFTCSEKSNEFSYELERETIVSFKHKGKNNITQVLNNIYKFRNFLMILLKKAIIVERQYIYINKERYIVFDCRNDELIKVKEDLLIHLNHRCLKIEDISNLSEICQNFFDNYDKLNPLLELYYNVTQFKVPNLLRFVNAVTMIEYLSRTFYLSQALALTKVNSPKRKDPEYKSMVISLINNVNSHYNFTSLEVEKIAKNIKNARDRYVHYLNKSSSKILSYDEQFRYSYFMEDIVLFNIYKVINLDINTYRFISFVDFYYDKEDLL